MDIDREDFDNSEEETYLVFVYGSLKRGYYNYYRLLNGNIGKSKYLHDATTKGTMYDLGPFPAVDIEGDGTIQGEIFEVDETVLFALDRLEGYPVYYNRSSVKLSTGEEALIYHIDREKIHSDKVVEDGNWKKV